VHVRIHVVAWLFLGCSRRAVPPCDVAFGMVCAAVQACHRALPVPVAVTVATSVQID